MKYQPQTRLKTWLEFGSSFSDPIEIGSQAIRIMDPENPGAETLFIPQKDRIIAKTWQKDAYFFLNGRRVQEADLKNLDQIQIGQNLVIFRAAYTQEKSEAHCGKKSPPLARIQASYFHIYGLWGIGFVLLWSLHISFHPVQQMSPLFLKCGAGLLLSSLSNLILFLVDTDEKRFLSITLTLATLIQFVFLIF
jgi:hypothetical protein